MKSMSIVFAILLVTALASGGYLFMKEYKPTREAYQTALRTQQNLERKITDLETELNQKVTEISKARKEKEEEITRVQAAKDSLISEMRNEINDNQIQITQMADKLKVTIVDRILFPSGQAEITDQGLEILQRVGNVLKNQKDKVIRVEGHTDNVPIAGRLAEIYPSNWELSTARATNVVRFLQEKVKIEPERLEAVGLSEFQPIADNSTREGKAQNRRIELALLPKK